MNDRDHPAPGAPDSPAQYEAWYAAPRGAWIAEREYRLLNRLLQPEPGTTLLDVGAGTGHFARRHAADGLQVTGLDPDRTSLLHAHDLAPELTWLAGDAQALPFADRSFDYCGAVASLCFVPDPVRALQEMWRVARHGVVLGLLHQPSRLHRLKAGRGGYRGARWDHRRAVAGWFQDLPGNPQPRFGWAVFLPGGGLIARRLEPIIPARLPLGGFMAVAAHH
ncbi:MAG: class I SAM-dependent methyltransferase [Pseudomonadota bacterium]